ncbi:MAG TPA: lipase family protein [Nevskia sp.]|jgi:hypothetical protein|nr:lipase family protein [Nevskia sp.]
MLTVLQVAVLGSQAIYDSSSLWDALFTGPDYADSYVGVQVRPQDRAVVVAFRGSTTPEDFFKDLEAAIPDDEAELGMVAHGFFEGTKALYAKIAPLIPAGYLLIITGHSLGAAQASDFAAFALARGTPVQACVLMGSPRPGLDTLNGWLRRVPSWYSFRNGSDLFARDPVPDVPNWGEHCRPLTALHEPPAPADPWGRLIGWHHSELYLAGIAKLTLPPLVA